MGHDAETVRADFDRIARAVRDPDAIDPLAAALVERLPTWVESVLEVGCGTGALARRLAARAGRVVAIDLSPEMVRVARARSTHVGNLDIVEADVLAWVGGGFDAVVSVATLHHLPLEAGLVRLRDAVRPRGRVLILDLPDTSGAWELPYNVICALDRLTHVGRWRAPHTAEEAAAWATHVGHDRYPRMREVRAVAARVLPGARVRRHLGWRYSIDATVGA